MRRQIDFSMIVPGSMGGGSWISVCVCGGVVAWVWFRQGKGVISMSRMIPTRMM